MKPIAIQLTKKITEEIYNKFDKGELDQGEAITKLHSIVSIFERCINKHHTPGDEAQDANLQRKANKQFPKLKLLALDLNPKIKVN